MKTIKAQVPLSEHQKQHVINHLLYDDELGIIASEFDHIRTKLSDFFHGRKQRLIRVVNADLNVPDCRWDVTCEIEDVI